MAFEEDRPQIVTDLTTGSIPRHVVRFSLPMLAGSALQVAYSVVNAVWVGLLGTGALAAVTVSQPVIYVLIALAAGLTLGANILVSQYVGTHELGRVRDTVRTAVWLTAGLSLVLLAAGQLYADRLLRLMNTPADTFPTALAYLHVYLWTLPFGFAIFLLGSLLRGIGDSRTPVYFQVVSVLLNAVLDPLLIFGPGRLPALGLTGAAWATFIAQAAAVAALAVYTARRRPLVWPAWPLRPHPAIAGLLLKIGLPAMVQQSTVSISLVAITGVVSTFGTVTDAAFGAALRIDGVAFLPALTIGMAVSTLAGQNIGAGRLDRVRQVFWWGLALSGGISLLITLVVISMPATLLRAFSAAPEVLAIGSGYLRIVGITYVLYAVMFVSNGIINGAGHTLATTLITVLALGGLRIPLAFLLPRYLPGPTGVWVAMLASVAVGMLLSLAYYAAGHWQTAVVKETPGAT